MTFIYNSFLDLPIKGPMIKDKIPLETIDKPVAAASFSLLTNFGMITDWNTAFIPLARPKMADTVKTKDGCS